MVASDKIITIKGIVDDLPLQEILEAAEIVVCVLPIPYLPAIIKVLKVAVKLSPAASKSLDAAAKISKSVETNISKMDETRNQFNGLMDMACSDGVITDAEKEFLRPRAIAAGISNDEFELMIINHLKK